MPVLSGTPIGRWLSRQTTPRKSQVVGMSWKQPLPSARDASPEAALTAFASMPIDMALDHLQTHKNGLTDIEAGCRLDIKGANVLPTHKAPSWILTLLRAIPNPFNMLLLLLAVIEVSVPGRDWAGITVMLIMVLISVLFRFWQEYRSSLAVFRLQASVTSDVEVRRKLSGKGGFSRNASGFTMKSVMEKDLVPGDVVVLSPGSVVPADCLILEASFLRISQSTWTGENEPVAKVANPTGDKEKEMTLFDMANVAFMGTSVITGNGVALVVRTGADVLIAGMAKELEKKRDTNAFQKGIRNVSWMLIGFMCVMVPIVLGINGKTTGDWNAAALFAISVAVGLVPEMLPAIVNANLARGAYLLSQKKAIVRRLDSVQNLGAMSVLCSDKDKITLCRHVDYSGADNESVLKLATIEAKTQGSNGNNIDAAIINHRLFDEKPVLPAHYETVTAIPFTFERRRSACIIRDANGPTLIVKGAFDEVLGLCSFVREHQGGSVVTLNVEKKALLLERANALQREGFRVLLVAEKQLARDSLTDRGCIQDLEDEDGLYDRESGMTLEGMLTFIDPPKEDAAEAIAQLKQLGVEVKVLTGDNLAVALTSCQLLGLMGPDDETDDEIQAITGPELAQLEADSDAFDAMVEKCKVFAKLTPTQKGLVIVSLRKAGHCVGMLGDGVNDCMALRKADVGISVDSGASVAKDCADLILTEKGLGLVVTSVRTGRVTHGNTIKYIKMVASSNFGNVFSVLASSAWLPYQPMLGLQILTQNLLYDVSQIAIPWDNVDPEYLETPKRWNGLDLLRFVLVLGPTSSVIDIMTYLLGWYYYGVQSTDDPEAIKMVQAHWFLQSILTQTLVVHLLRTAKLPFIQSRAATPLLLSTSAIMAIGFAVPWIPPFQAALDFARPAATYVGIIAAQLVLYCIIVQIVKMIYMRVFKTWL